MKNKNNSYNVWAAVENFCAVVGPHIPAARVKGAGHDPRIRLSRIVNYNAQVPQLRAILAKHGVPAVSVSIARKGGYGGDVDFVSVALGRGLRHLFLAA